MRAKNTLALAGLSCMLLAACSSTDSGSTAMSRSGENVSSTGSATQAATTPAPGSSDTGSMNATTSGSDMSMDGSQSGISIASATVQSIEPVARGMDQASGEAQMGSSGTAGTTAGSAGNTMYRVTLRLDDGSTRTIMQNSAPTYQTGDRVKLVNGLLQKY